MSRVRVARELDGLVGGQLEDLLEPLADGKKYLLALLRRAALAARDVAIAAAGDALADGAGPHADAEEGFPDVDDDAHDLAVVLVLEGLADGGHHGLQPELVDVDAPLVLELVGPLAAVLVLGVLPLGPHALFEEVVVGLHGEIGNRCDIVLLKWIRVG